RGAWRLSRGRMRQREGEGQADGGRQGTAHGVLPAFSIVAVRISPAREAQQVLQAHVYLAPLAGRGIGLWRPSFKNADAKLALFRAIWKRFFQANEKRQSAPADSVPEVNTMLRPSGDHAG